jgi:hypothetical protein
MPTAGSGTPSAAKYWFIVLNISGYDTAHLGFTCPVGPHGCTAHKTGQGLGQRCATRDEGRSAACKSCGHCSSLLENSPPEPKASVEPGSTKRRLKSPGAYSWPSASISMSRTPRSNSARARSRAAPPESQVTETGPFSLSPVTMKIMNSSRFVSLLEPVIKPDAVSTFERPDVAFRRPG